MSFRDAKLSAPDPLWVTREEAEIYLSKISELKPNFYDAYAIDSEIRHPIYILDNDVYAIQEIKELKDRKRQVRYMQNLKTDEVIVLKTIKMDSKILHHGAFYPNPHVQNPIKVRNELKILNHLKKSANPAYIKREMTDGAVAFDLLMKRARGVSLTQFLKEKPNMSQELRDKIARKILIEVEAMHGKGILHCDLKNDHIFISVTPEEEVHVDIVDYGSALWMNDASAVARGTSRFMAPEIKQIKSTLNKITYNENTEMYALGVIFHDLYKNDEVNRDLILVMCAANPIYRPAIHEVFENLGTPLNLEAYNNIKNPIVQPTAEEISDYKKEVWKDRLNKLGMFLLGVVIGVSAIFSVAMIAGVGSDAMLAAGVGLLGGFLTKLNQENFFIKHKKKILVGLIITASILLGSVSFGLAPALGLTIAGVYASIGSAVSFGALSGVWASAIGLAAAIATSVILPTVCRFAEKIYSACKPARSAGRQPAESRDALSHFFQEEKPLDEYPELAENYQDFIEEKVQYKRPYFAKPANEAEAHHSPKPQIRVS